MQGQKHQIHFLDRLMQLRRYPGIAKPVLRLVQRTLFKNIRLVPAKDYFSVVMQAANLTPKHSLEHYIKELAADQELKERYLAAISAGKMNQKYAQYEERFGFVANVVQYYALIRELEPEIVLETGTATGSMTSWVLKALYENKKGKLISIDLPPQKDVLTMNINVSSGDLGFLIPDKLKARWDLRLGDAKILLPKILAENPVDVFIHDSLHTVTHMSLEYNLARALLRPGALILSDDILWNHSWYKFLETHELLGLSCDDNPNLGITVNRFDSFETDQGLGIVKLTQ